jgi:GNAT superfamily N-acetyltransferase
MKLRFRASKNAPELLRLTAPFSVSSSLDFDFKSLVERYLDLGLIVDLWQMPEFLDLKTLVVPKALRGQGLGSKFMTELSKLADSKQLTIFLTPSKDFGATSVERLKQFYRRFGFHPNTGKYKDFRSWNGMVRQPQKR